MIHASGAYAVNKIGSFNFWVGNILDGSGQIAVPLFVMISGALMLDKNYDFSFIKLKKHIIRMVLFFVFWSLIYCVVFNVLSPSSHRALVSGLRMLRSHCTKRSSRAAGSQASSPRWTSATKYIFDLDIYAKIRTRIPTMAQ